MVTVLKTSINTQRMIASATKKLTPITKPGDNVLLSGVLRSVGGPSGAITTINNNNNNKQQ